MGIVILNLTLHVPQAELREKLSLHVSLVLALGIKSYAQKKNERICRLNKEKCCLRISSFMLLTNINKNSHPLTTLSVAFSFSYLLGVCGEGPP